MGSTISAGYKEIVVQVGIPVQEYHALIILQFGFVMM
jgi:hypothetical protein